MANTYVDYTATAAQTDFAFSFPYLEDSHVVVEIDGVVKTLTTDYTIVTTPSKKIVLTSGATAGQVVRVRRDSNADGTNPFVDFVNGSVLTEDALDKSYLHNLYLNEEIGELNEASLQRAVGGTEWDAKNSRILNVADPTGTQDAGTKNYIDTQITNTVTGSSTTAAKTTFTGDGSTVFTFGSGITLDGDTMYEVAIDGVLQEPTVAYAINANANTITFTSTPPSSSNIVVVQRGYAVPVTTGSVSGSQLATGSVDSTKIATSAVTADAIATGAVGSSEIADNAITNDHYSELNGAKITTSSIGSNQIAPSAVTASEIADGTVGNDELASEAVTAAKISTTDGTFNVDSVNNAVGIGIAHEDAYALKTSKLKIEGTATQMYIKDSDETGTPTEIAISLNDKALRFGFQDSPTTQAFAIFGRNLTIAGGTVAELNALTAADGAIEGQVAMCSNGNSGSRCLAIYTGTYGAGGSWKVLATVGSAISA